MNNALVIAWNDLRLFLKYGSGYFWLFVSPLLFAFFMGMMNRGDGDPANARPSLFLENNDRGYFGALLIEELGVQGLRVIDSAEGAERGLRIPEDFTKRILAKDPAPAELFRIEGSSEESGFIVELRLARAIVALNSHLVEQASETDDPSEQRLRALIQKENPVALRATFASRKPLPAGYDQSVPGILVMFTMLNLLTFGGASIAGERREGVMRRLMAQPIARGELVFGKIGGLLLLGIVQVAVLLGAAFFFWDFKAAGNLAPILLIMIVYAWAAAALGVLIGSLIVREDKVVAISVMASMVMAAMGGCWWPLEIVPENVRLAGHIFPTAWAMDALHQVVSFGGGLPHIWQDLLVLSGYAIAASVAAVRFFRT